MAEPSLLNTMTGECTQPVRLIYRVKNQKKLLEKFRKLRCLDYDPSQKRWVWLYQEEAKRLRFKISYEQLQPEVHPLIIGSFFLRPGDQLLLDVRSPERALVAIPFFDKCLTRRLVELKEAEIVNRLFQATKDDMVLTPDALFDSEVRTSFDPDELKQELGGMIKPGQSLEERFEIVKQVMASQAQDQLPEIERFPVHYHEDGISGFKLAVRIRQVIAREHWRGNTSYTMNDAIQRGLGLA